MTKDVIRSEYLYPESWTLPSTKQIVAMSKTKIEVDAIQKGLEEHFADKGLEVYPFKVGWYNEKVLENYKLPYPEDTLVFIVISIPEMFEKCFVPFVRRQTEITEHQDLIDKCMIEIFQTLKPKFPDNNLEIMHDFELHHSRRPKILVQTAGHVAGAAYYYQQSDLKDIPPSDTPEKKRRKLFGVSLHPKYGGWFALRGVVIFTDTTCDLEPKQALQLLQTDAEISHLLEKFNYHWQDWRYRNVIPVEDKYSPQQMKYFETLPKDRGELVEQIRKNGKIETDK